MTDTTTAQQPAASISIVDLQNVIQIIDVSSERGAFRGNELSSVGTVRDKIAAFVAANAPKEETAPEGEQDASQAENTDSEKASS